MYRSKDIRLLSLTSEGGLCSIEISREYHARGGTTKRIEGSSGGTEMKDNIQRNKEV